MKYPWNMCKIFSLDRSKKPVGYLGRFYKVLSNPQGTDLQCNPGGQILKISRSFLFNVKPQDAILKEIY